MSNVCRGVDDSVDLFNNKTKVKESQSQKEGEMNENVRYNRKIYKRHAKRR